MVPAEQHTPALYLGEEENYTVLRRTIVVFKTEGIQVPTLDLGRSFDDLHCLLLKHHGAFNNKKLSQAGFYVSLKTNSGLVSFA